MQRKTLSVALVVILGVAVVFSLPRFIANAADAPAPGAAPAVKPDGSAWTLSRGDSGQTGVAHAKLADKLALRWSFKPPVTGTSSAAPIKATPIVADGKAFIGSFDGRFYAVDLKTGKELWHFDTIHGPLPKDAGPKEKKYSDSIEGGACYIDGRVYFGSHDGNLYCLDAKTGKMLWAFETRDKITAAPNWVKSPDGKETWVLVGSNDAKLYCVEAVTGRKVWEYETGNIINGAPAVAGGVTVFGGCDGLVHIVNIADGKKAGEVTITDYIAASAALEGDRAYVGHHGNKFICVDLKEKKIAWQFGDKEFPYMASAALTKDAVIFGGQDRRVHAVNKATGKGIWEFRSRGQFNSSPVIVGERVVLGCDDGRVYMLNIADGEEVWSYEIGQSVAGSPAVVDGMLLIGSDDGALYAFGDEKK